MNQIHENELNHNCDGEIQGSLGAYTGRICPNLGGDDQECQRSDNLAKNKRSKRISWAEMTG